MPKADSPANVPSAAPWSVPVTVDNIPDHGMHVAIDAPEAIRAQVLALVSGLASVRELVKLSAVFDLTRRGARVHVTGHVSARVAQTCVVTLEPIESDVEEAVDVQFASAPAHDKAADPEIEVKLGAEPPEPMLGGVVDLGALATEFLVLGINPHPRKAGAEFAPVKIGDDGAHAFAALEALKKPSGGGTP